MLGCGSEQALKRRGSRSHKHVDHKTGGINESREGIKLQLQSYHGIAKENRKQTVQSTTAEEERLVSRKKGTRRLAKVSVLAEFSTLEIAELEPGKGVAVEAALTGIHASRKLIELKWP